MVELRRGHSNRERRELEKSKLWVSGADPGFFLGGGAPPRNSVTNTNKPHFFFAENQLY